MKSYTFRIVIDTKEDSFRDIEISKDDNFETLHDLIIEAYNFKGDQMTSFYMSDDNWDKGEEIALMDMGFGKSMKETLLSDMVKEPNQKILYVYDFLKMWIFYIELIKENSKKTVDSLPSILVSVGESPKEESKEVPNLLEGMTESSKSSEVEDFYSQYGDEFSEDFDEGFGSFENIDDLDI